MSKSKKPRKAYRPRGLIDPVATAIRRAAKLTDRERALLIGPVKECIERLMFGRFTNADFKHLADALNIAQALTMPGIGLLPDHEDKFEAAHRALQAMAQRWNAGGSWIARGDELQAIKLGVEFHEIQLEFASAGELAKATIIVDRTLTGAVSGSPGRKHIHTVLRAA